MTEPTLTDVMAELHRLHARLDKLTGRPSTATVYMRIKQAAQQYGIPSHTLYRMTDLHHRQGRTIFIKRVALEAKLNQLR